MSGWMIIGTGLVYTYVAIEQWVKDNPAMSLAYAGYAFSNIGLYMALK